jgi:L-alanine-DL-glutamate epimerase-like enolase superfamily enzyme
MDARDQAAVDAALCALDGTANKARLGANAVVAVSMAVLHAAAADAREPLWRYLAEGRKVRIPLPEIQIFGGGAHAGRRTDVQDFMIMCPKAGSFRRALEITDDVYRAAGRLMEAKGPLSGVADEGGWWPNFASNEDALDTLTRAIDASGHRAGDEVFISLDIAANELGDASGYNLALDDRRLPAEEMAARIIEWTRAYPILSVEDPAGQDDWTTMAAVTAAVGDRVQIIGDDVLVTSAERVVRAGNAAVCNAALIKVNQVGTVTEAKGGARRCGRAGLGRDRLGALGRERRYHHRASGDGLERRTIEGRQLHAVRTHGEVERDAADRGSDGRRCGVCGLLRLCRIDRGRGGMIVLHARPSPGFRDAVDRIFGTGVVTHVDEASSARRSGWRDHRAAPCADAGDGRFHRLGAEAETDPEAWGRREHHRARCRARAWRRGVQHAGNEQPGGRRNGTCRS